MQLNKTGPSAAGSKTVPEGGANCLRGLTFVFTGELSSIDREQSADLARRYGGRVTSAVSRKTDYLVVGEKDVGATKINKATALGTATLDEDGFFNLIATSPAKEDDFGSVDMEGDSLSLDSTPKKVTRKRGRTEDDSTNKEKEEMKPLLKPQRTHSPTKTRSQTSVEPKGKEPSKLEPPSSSPSPSSPSPAPQLWTEKYAPKSIGEICGNKKIVQDLVHWLRHFEPFPSVKKSTMDGSKRAVLLSGPPGLGKTTAARLAAKEAGYQVWELNASDTRNQAVLREALGVGTVTRSVMGGKVVLVMDEVDGMSSGDRGGMATLIKALKSSRIPIVCICNDRQATSVRSLINYCLHLPFRRPDASSLRSRLLTIAHREGLRVPAQVMDSLVTASNSDFRLILNTLSVWATGQGEDASIQKAMSWEEGKELGGSMNKHILLGPYDAAKKLLSPTPPSQASLDSGLGLHFMDAGLVPLMVQDNYLRMSGGSLEAMSMAADSISDSDLLDSLIHRYGS